MIVEELKRQASIEPSLISIGVFDGVHLGHRHLLNTLKERASQLGVKAKVVTFYRHPREVLEPGSSLPYLTSLKRRLELLQELGLEVCLLTFTPQLAAMGAREFVELLIQHLKLQGLVIGPDFALGRNREGDADFLHRLGQELGFFVEQVPPKRINGEVISSTAIRQALAKGDMTRVARFLGYPFRLEGKVIPGDERGRILGFPTANLEISRELALPPDGVYATRVYLGNHPVASVTNIGTRPTFGLKERSVEVHLLDFQENLYGRELTLEIIARLREERKFSSPEALRLQIQQDIEETRKILQA